MSDRHCGNCGRDGDTLCLSRLIKYYNTSQNVGGECQYFMAKRDGLARTVRRNITQPTAKPPVRPVRSIHRPMPKKSKSLFSIFFKDIKDWGKDDK